MRETLKDRFVSDAVTVCVCVSVNFLFYLKFAYQQVSPHEFLQAVMKASKKRFRIGAQSDPVEFVSWLLNTLHADLKTSKKNMSIIYECFQVLFTLISFFVDIF
jgi:ubiquitin C-terminal hydrolase